MAMKFELGGTASLARAFAQLPAELAAEGAQLAAKHAATAYEAIRATYTAHAVTGRLGGSLSWAQKSAGPAPKVLVIARAPHAHLFERGTKARRTRKGWNRGAARPGGIRNAGTFIPAMQAARRAFDDGVADLLRRAGLEVRR